MNRADIRSYAVTALIMILSSLVFLTVLDYYIRQQKDTRQQEEIAMKMSPFLVADRYDLLSSELTENQPLIQSVYLALDENGKLLGYIVDVYVADENGSQNARICISPDGENVMTFRFVSDDGFVNDYLESEYSELYSQLENIRMPVALFWQMNDEVMTQNEYPSPEGLHDGIFYAEAEEYDSAGFKDFVEIVVSDGRIVEVLWDATSQDGGKNKAQSSVDGEYIVSKTQEIWAVQANAIQKQLVEVQDPVKLAIKSDGTTEIVDGVTMNLNMFYTLSVTCIDNSRNNIQKRLDEPEITGESDVIETTVSETVETTVILTEEGDLTPSPTPTPTPTPSPSPSPTPTPSPTPSPTPVASVSGNEDGVVDPNQKNVLSNSIDGLPVSEIQTRIQGISSNLNASVRAVTAVNTAYIFLKEYFLWEA